MARLVCWCLLGLLALATAVTESPGAQLQPDEAWGSMEEHGEAVREQNTDRAQRILRFFQTGLGLSAQQFPPSSPVAGATTPPRLQKHIGKECSFTDGRSFTCQDIQVTACHETDLKRCRGPARIKCCNQDSNSTSTSAGSPQSEQATQSTQSAQSTQGTQGTTFTVSQVLAGVGAGTGAGVTATAVGSAGGGQFGPGSKFPMAQAQPGTPPPSKILVIGDSHTQGSFGKHLYEMLQAAGHVVEVRGACGMRAASFRSGGQTNCGLRENLQQKGRVATPKFSDLMSLPTWGGSKPDVVVAALGANGLTGTQQLAADIVAAGSKCLWVGPPHTRKRSDEKRNEIYRGIETQAGAHCALFDSRPTATGMDFLVYPATGGDGAHYSGRAGSELTSRWAVKVIEAISALLLPPPEQPVVPANTGAQQPAANNAPETETYGMNDPTCIKGSSVQANCEAQAVQHFRDAMQFFGVHPSFLPIALSIGRYESGLIPNNENTGSGAMGLLQWMPAYDLKRRQSFNSAMQQAAQDPTKASARGLRTLMSKIGQCQQPAKLTREERTAIKNQGQCWFNIQYGAWIGIRGLMASAPKCGGHNIQQPITSLQAAAAICTDIYICWNSGRGNFRAIKQAQAGDRTLLDQRAQRSKWLPGRVESTQQPVKRFLSGYWQKYSQG